MNKHYYLALAISALGFTQAVYATSPTGSIRLEAGTEYDSNLGVVELDQYSRQSDWAALLNVRLNGRWQASEKTEFKAGYTYADKSYLHNDNFDLTLQQLFVDASHQFDLLTLGASYHHADAALAGHDFLQLQQTSVYASRLFQQRVFVRAALNHQAKHFPTITARNATNTGLTGDVFIFFQQGNRFIAAGISNETEDAKQNEFSYDALSLRASINQKFSAWGKPNKVQLGVRYQDRHYTTNSTTNNTTNNSANNNDLNYRRADRQRIASLEWEINLTPTVTATSKLERGNYESNVAAADYSETLASVTFALRF